MAKVEAIIEGLQILSKYKPGQLPTAKARWLVIQHLEHQRYAENQMSI